MIETVSPESVGLDATQLLQLDTAMQKHIDQGHLSGMVILLARSKQIAHARCYGIQDLVTQRPMEQDTLFRIFSMTKPVTSLAVLMLFEQGHLDLDCPISVFVPDFEDMQVLVNQSDAGAGVVPLDRPITIHDLLTHTSGLGYGLDVTLPVDALYVQDAILRTDEPMSAKIARIVNRPLHHQPGLRYTYSIATDILGLLVELVSGLSLDVFFREKIFKPLRMENTGFFIPADDLDRLAPLYTTGPDGRLLDVTCVPREKRPQFLRDHWIDKSKKPLFLSGGGGLVSTAADYLRFAMMLANKGTFDGTALIKHDTFVLMVTPHLTPQQFLIPGCSSGYGLTVLTDPVLAQLPGSKGAFGGGGAASTDFWVDPGRDLVGVLMTQYVATTPCTVAMDFKRLASQAIIE